MNISFAFRSYCRQNDHWCPSPQKLAGESCFNSFSFLLSTTKRRLHRVWIIADQIDRDQVRERDLENIFCLHKCFNPYLRRHNVNSMWPNASQVFPLLIRKLTCHAFIYSYKAYIWSPFSGFGDFSCWDDTSQNCFHWMRGGH